MSTASAPPALSSTRPDAPPSFEVRPSLGVQPRPWRPILGWVLGLCALAALGLGWVWASTVRDVLADYDSQLAALETKLMTVPLLTGDELAKLRRSPNAQHVEAAQDFGITPIETRAGLDSARVFIQILS